MADDVDKEALVVPEDAERLTKAGRKYADARFSEVRVFIAVMAIITRLLRHPHSGCVVTMVVAMLLLPATVCWWWNSTNTAWCLRRSLSHYWFSVFQRFKATQSSSSIVDLTTYELYKVGSARTVQLFLLLLTEIV